MILFRSASLRAGPATSSAGGRVQRYVLFLFTEYFAANPCRPGFIVKPLKIWPLCALIVLSFVTGTAALYASKGLSSRAGAISPTPPAYSLTFYLIVSEFCCLPLPSRLLSAAIRPARHAVIFYRAVFFSPLRSTFRAVSHSAQAVYPQAARAGALCVRKRPHIGKERFSVIYFSCFSIKQIIKFARTARRPFVALTGSLLSDGTAVSALASAPRPQIPLRGNFLNPKSTASPNFIFFGRRECLNLLRAFALRQGQVNAPLRSAPLTRKSRVVSGTSFPPPEKNFFLPRGNPLTEKGKSL